MKNIPMKRMFSTMLAACCMAVSAMDPTALLTADAAYSTGTYTVSGQSANIRQTPGEAIVGYAANGTSFAVTSIDGGWGYSASIPATSGKTVAGWVYLENCTMSAGTSLQTGFAVGSMVEITNTAQVNFRSGAGTSYALLGTIPKGTVLTVSEVSGDWLKVNYNGTNGWFKSTYCKAYTQSASAGSSSSASASSVAAVGEQIVIVNTDQVNFRSGAGTNYNMLGTIPQGTVLVVSEISGSWFHVSYNGQNGWVSSAYCKKYTAPVANSTAAVGDKVEIANTDEVNFRSGAGTGYSKIGTIPRGTVLTVSEVSGNWFKTTYNGQTGWFSSGYCKKYTGNTSGSADAGTAESGEMIRITASVAVYLRTGAGVSYNPIGLVPSGKILTVIEAQNGWYRVNYEGKTGWITSHYTEKYTDASSGTASDAPAQTVAAVAAGDVVKINVFSVNLRTGAGTNYQSIGTIPRNTVLTIKEVTNGWCRTEYNGKTGWFVAQYCEKYTEETASGTDTSTEESVPVLQAGDSVRTVYRVYMRSGGGLDYEQIDVIENGEILTVEEVAGEWIRITRNGKTGWMCSRYCVKITADTSESVTVAGKLTVNAAVSVHLRKEASAASEIIGYIKGGAELEYTNKSNGWYHVIYKGKTGWISGTYVKLS